MAPKVIKTVSRNPRKTRPKPKSQRPARQRPAMTRRQRARYHGRQFMRHARGRSRRGAIYNGVAALGALVGLTFVAVQSSATVLGAGLSFGATAISLGLARWEQHLIDKSQGYERPQGQYTRPAGSPSKPRASGTKRWSNCSSRCRNSTKPVSTCKCSCGGKTHGKPVTASSNGQGP